MNIPSTQHRALERIQALCTAIYGPDIGQTAFAHLRNVIAAQPVVPPPRATALTERDAMLITYGDHVREAGQAPLSTLATFCETHLSDTVSAIHVLPFYPYTSDDGFAVTDYRAVRPDLGAWDDIARLGARFRLMFDAVVNHVSSRSAWFQAYLRGEAPYRDYFITVEGTPDLSQVVRPRALPLLTTVDTAEGPRKVWTTFSEDQIDLNYANPAVLAEMVDLLLFYAGRGAAFIRLDAIAYLWKEIGTPCIHLPNTHRVVQLFRAALDAVAPHVRLITETNVPHAENLSYFGDGENEAQLVYNFALPPLVLHTLQTGDARALSAWASTLRLPSPHTTFLNFLASHDGIGLNPARGILTDRQIADLVDRAQMAGGFVGEKSNPDGSRSPYELNINYFDALSAGAMDEQQTIQRFIAAHAILCALVGMPAIYFHSLFGSRGWPEGVSTLGHKRAINRQKLERTDVERELGQAGSRRARIFFGLKRLLRARAQSTAFHPHGQQQVIEAGPAVFALLRRAADDSQRAICLVNVSPHPQSARMQWRELLGRQDRARELIDDTWLSPGGSTIELAPYEARWFATHSSH
ncbi:MAG: alpha-amylase family glycosyl hydrolase [Anaerolineae bacterium]